MPRIFPCMDGQQRAPQEQLMKAGQAAELAEAADPVPNLSILDHQQVAQGNGTQANHVQNPLI